MYEQCGTGPFARVQATHKPANQSVPLTGRDSTSTNPGQAVRGLTLDYDFAQVPPSCVPLHL
jgi:hypothetical protein